jgi:hypothetical protein
VFDGNEDEHEDKGEDEDDDDDNMLMDVADGALLARKEAHDLLPLLMRDMGEVCGVLCGCAGEHVRYFYLCAVARNGRGTWYVKYHKGQRRRVCCVPGVETGVIDILGKWMMR